MSDDKHSTDGRDRSKVSGSEDYEVRHIAEKHGISMDQARDVIARHGPGREAVDAAAARLK